MEKTFSLSFLALALPYFFEIILENVSVPAMPGRKALIDHFVHIF